MKTFKDLEFVEHPSHIGGVQARIQFENGHGASVVKTPYSYGGDRGLYELAVLKDDELHYDNPVANGDVRGFLTEDAVTELLIQIQKL
jgi:hypothetical protein